MNVVVYGFSYAVRSALEDILRLADEEEQDGDIDDA